jgi:hypothetical protein
LARGNHKSARGHEATKLLEMLNDEVKCGWQLPLPKEAALELLPHCEVAPLGVVSQTTLGADGTKETKLRLTHEERRLGPLRVERSPTMGPADERSGGQRQRTCPPRGRIREGFHDVGR